MSLETLITRFTKGQHVATFQPIYQGDEDTLFTKEFDKMNTMDRVEELHELKQKTLQEDDRIKTNRAQRKAARAQKAAQKQKQETKEKTPPIPPKEEKTE